VRVGSHYNRMGVQNATVLDLEYTDARGRQRVKQLPWWARQTLEDPAVIAP
jgi:hypothetical protein